MFAVTAEQMRIMENKAIHELGIPSLLLMENAAIHTAMHIQRLIEPNNHIAVVCGPGNNGGDGYAIARKLFTQGMNVSVVSVREPSTDDALINRDLCKKLNIPFLPVLDKSVDIVVDALFGTGLTRAPEGLFAEAIRSINTYGKKIVSVDIPSGFCSDIGKALGETVKAHTTVTFGFPKIGLYLYPCAACTGEIHIVNISIPQQWSDDYGQGVEVLDNEDIKSLFPIRKAYSNKGDYGRVCVIAGSPQMPGAAVLCCTGAYRIGAGLVDAYVQPEVAKVIHQHLPEAITSTKFNKAQVVLLGPGLGQDSVALLHTVFSQIKCPLVLDADGLNMVANDLSLLDKLSVPCVITPHPGEMSRLTGKPIDEIIHDPISAARNFAYDFNVHVLLKGTRTVISAPDGRIILNTTGSASLAKAGSGDVLAGITAGLVAQGLDVFTAAAVGAYVHGKAGEMLPLHSALASDIVDVLPEVIHDLMT